MWDQTVRQPVARYPAGDWAKANRELDLSDGEPAPSVAPAGASSGSGGLVSVIILVLIVGIAYIWFHAHRYSGCVISPGIFDWPAVCL